MPPQNSIFRPVQEPFFRPVIDEKEEAERLRKEKEEEAKEAAKVAEYLKKKEAREQEEERERKMVRGIGYGPGPFPYSLSPYPRKRIDPSTDYYSDAPEWAPPSEHPIRDALWNAPGQFFDKLVGLPRAIWESSPAGSAGVWNEEKREARESGRYKEWEAEKRAQFESEMKSYRDSPLKQIGGMASIGAEVDPTGTLQGLVSGIPSSINEFSKGNLGSGAFDLTMSLAPILGGGYAAHKLGTAESAAIASARANVIPPPIIRGVPGVDPSVPVPPPPARVAVADIPSPQPPHPLPPSAAGHKFGQFGLRGSGPQDFGPPIEYETITLSNGRTIRKPKIPDVIDTPYNPNATIPSRLQPPSTNATVFGSLLPEEFHQVPLERAAPEGPLAGQSRGNRGRIIPRSPDYTGPVVSEGLPTSPETGAYPQRPQPSRLERFAPSPEELANEKRIEAERRGSRVQAPERTPEDLANERRIALEREGVTGRDAVILENATDIEKERALSRAHESELRRPNRAIVDNMTESEKLKILKRMADEETAARKAAESEGPDTTTQAGRYEAARARAAANEKGTSTGMFNLQDFYEKLMETEPGRKLAEKLKKAKFHIIDAETLRPIAGRGSFEEAQEYAKNVNSNIGAGAARYQVRDNETGQIHATPDFKPYVPSPVQEARIPQEPITRTPVIPTEAVPAPPIAARAEVPPPARVKPEGGRGYLPSPDTFQDITARSLAEQVALKDKAGSPDSAYRNIVSYGRKATLDRGQTWRGKVLETIEANEQSYRERNKETFVAPKARNQARLAALMGRFNRVVNQAQLPSTSASARKILMAEAEGLKKQMAELESKGTTLEMGGFQTLYEKFSDSKLGGKIKKSIIEQFDKNELPVNIGSSRSQALEFESKFRKELKESKGIPDTSNFDEFLNKEFKNTQGLLAETIDALEDNLEGPQNIVEHNKLMQQIEKGIMDERNPSKIMQNLADLEQYLEIAKLEKDTRKITTFQDLVDLAKRKFKGEFDDEGGGTDIHSGGFQILYDKFSDSKLGGKFKNLVRGAFGEGDLTDTTPSGARGRVVPFGKATPTKPIIPKTLTDRFNDIHEAVLEMEEEVLPNGRMRDPVYANEAKDRIQATIDEMSAQEASWIGGILEKHAKDTPRVIRSMIYRLAEHAKERVRKLEAPPSKARTDVDPSKYGEVRPFEAKESTAEKHSASPFKEEPIDFPYKKGASPDQLLDDLIAKGPWNKDTHRITDALHDTVNKMKDYNEMNRFMDRLARMYNEPRDFYTSIVDSLRSDLAKKINAIGEEQTKTYQGIRKDPTAMKMFGKWEKTVESILDETFPESKPEGDVIPHTPKPKFEPGVLVRSKSSGKVGRIVVTPEELQKMTVQELDRYSANVKRVQKLELAESDAKILKEIADEFERRRNIPGGFHEPSGKPKGEVTPFKPKGPEGGHFIGEGLGSLQAWYEKLAKSKNEKHHALLEKLKTSAFHVVNEEGNPIAGRDTLEAAEKAAKLFNKERGEGFSVRPNTPEAPEPISSRKDPKDIAPEDRLKTENFDPLLKGLSKKKRKFFENILSGFELKDRPVVGTREVVRPAKINTDTPHGQFMQRLRENTSLQAIRKYTRREFHADQAARMRGVITKGEAGVIERATAMEGTMEDIVFPPLKMEQGVIDQLIDAVHHHHKGDIFKQQRAGQAVRMMNNGKFVPDAQLKLVADAFPEQYRTEIMNIYSGIPYEHMAALVGPAKGVVKKLAGFAYRWTAGSARTLKPGFDVSMLFIQGSGAKHTRAFREAIRPMREAFKSKERYDFHQNKIMDDPYYDFITEDMGVHFSDMKKKKLDEFKHGNPRLEKMETMKKFQRMAITFLNQTKYGLSKTFIKLAEKKKIDVANNVEWAQSTGKIINEMTGYGTISKRFGLPQATKLGSHLLWSQRLTASRINYLKLFSKEEWVNPNKRFAQKRRLASATQMAATSFAMMKAAEMMGAKAHYDPFDPMFGRIEFAGQVLDTTASFGPLVSLIARSIKLGATGEITDSKGQKLKGRNAPNTLGLIGSYFENKLAPGPAFLEKLIRQKNPYTNKPYNIPAEALNLSVPFVVENAYSAFKGMMKSDPEIAKLFLLIPGVAGFNYYSNSKNKETTLGEDIVEKFGYVPDKKKSFSEELFRPIVEPFR